VLLVVVQIGFGEAGSKIIAHNLSESGDIDPMIPGLKVSAPCGVGCDLYLVDGSCRLRLSLGSAKSGSFLTQLKSCKRM